METVDKASSSISIQEKNQQKLAWKRRLETRCYLVASWMNIIGFEFF